MRRFARTLTRDPEVAADLVQETMLAALHTRPSLARPLRSWLARVLRNRAALAWRNGSTAAEHDVDLAFPVEHTQVERDPKDPSALGSVLGGEVA